jgi:large subunit ribosomal protein L19
VRRAKLYYLRGRTGKSARIAEKRRSLLVGMGVTAQAKAAAAAAAEPAEA